MLVAKSGCCKSDLKFSEPSKIGTNINVTYAICDKCGKTAYVMDSPQMDLDLIRYINARKEVLHVLMAARRLVESLEPDFNGRLHILILKIQELDEKIQELDEKIQELDEKHGKEAGT